MIKKIFFSIYYQLAAICGVLELPGLLLRFIGVPNDLSLDITNISLLQGVLSIYVT